MSSRRDEPRPWRGGSYQDACGALFPVRWWSAARAALRRQRHCAAGGRSSRPKPDHLIAGRRQDHGPDQVDPKAA
ncbi:hypothetical protein chiPu_0032360 [Chiloscyllium punctatum]|uniref:Uncharacterized protein n=1 Tax=Chiloscyllium punctatum TaxID=137246 RepID=A0A401U077_CHIPU|nr:hypothetical protein [Chiloscyllium punctatum]